MVAEAAEGSVRDGLSILDQAIAHADLAGDAEHTNVTAEQVRRCWALPTRGAAQIVRGLAGRGWGRVARCGGGAICAGVEPLSLMRSAMDITHRITVAQVGRGEVKAVSEDERKTIEDWAKRLHPGQLHRLWQLLLKGHDEVKTAPAFGGGRNGVAAAMPACGRYARSGAIGEKAGRSGGAGCRHARTGRIFCARSGRSAIRSPAMAGSAGRACGALLYPDGGDDAWTGAGD
jgi:hypothetical protein